MNYVHYPNRKPTYMKKFFFLFFIGLAGCSKSSTNNDQSLLPLNKGNRWIYAVSIYNTVGNLVSEKKDTSTFENWKAEGVSSTNSEIRSNGEVFFKRTEKLDTFYIGANSLIWNGQNLSGKTYAIAFPGTEKIGDYNCFRCDQHHYDKNGKLFGKSVYYVQPGIGIVRIQFFDEDRQGGIRKNIFLAEQKQLIEHTLK